MLYEVGTILAKRLSDEDSSSFAEFAQIQVKFWSVDCQGFGMDVPKILRNNTLSNLSFLQISESVC